MAEAFDEHGEEARAKAKPPAFGVPVIPLLWVLVPQIAAFAFFGNVPWADEISVGRRLIAGVIFLAISAIASAIELLFSGTETRFRSAVYFWKMSFPVAAFFLFGAWWSLRAPPVVELAGTPAREAEIVLCVEKPFAASEKYFGGIARAETVSGFGGEALAGTRVRYSFARKNFPPDAERNRRREFSLRGIPRIFVAGTRERFVFASGARRNSRFGAGRVPAIFFFGARFFAGTV